MSLFVSDEIEMALFQSEKLMRNIKAEAKLHKRIMEDLELRDARNEKRWKQYAVIKQKKKKGEKPLMKVIHAQWLKWRTQKQNQKARKQLELAVNLNDPSLSVSGSFPLKVKTSKN